ncbi:hypothetical protein ACJIZ3_003339 [Penstemon smallii]|uniref:Uncharacterized protein n=1 Tax=Penstemon smallii TaxID=265156 RepID=A0ABD3UAJ5_9LAMI
MGGCLSSSSSESTDYSSRGGGNSRKPSANVVSANGQLRQYSVPITVSQVLQSETTSPDSFFLCNSDCLYFDDFIPSLDPENELQSGQIYFVLPVTKLQYRLAASDMAALAVKASVAMEQINRRGNRTRKARISPVLVAEGSNYDQVNQTYKSGNGYSKVDQTKPGSTGVGISRSGSVRRLSKYTSRRAKMAVRSFRIKLSTINEGSVLVHI